MHRELTPGEVAAVCYGDVFNYPLTQQELSKFKISCHSGRRAGIYKNNLMDPRVKPEDDIQTKAGFYFLKGREKLVTLRKKRVIWSKPKLQIVEKVSKYLCYIPTIQMISVTGALAMENCDKDDDIDLLIVSKSGTVWTTRFLSICVLELLGKRRRPKDSKSSNKVCLNMFIDEGHLEVPKKEQDIFAAHEVAQVKILWSRGGVESRFWKKNEWIKRYLSNYQYSIINDQINSKSQTSIIKRKHFQFENWLLKFSWNLYIRICNLGEEALKKIQLFYMQNRRTEEVIKDGYLRFHPHDARKWIIPEYEKRLAIVGLK